MPNIGTYELLNNFQLSGLAHRSAETKIEGRPIADIGISTTYGMRLGLGDDSSTTGGH